MSRCRPPSNRTQLHRIARDAVLLLLSVVDLALLAWATWRFLGHPVGLEAADVVPPKA